jgi:branched-chain amino acid transport system ATP-binding protein
MDISHMLRIDDIVVYYGRVVALRGISLQVKEREMVTLIGANGAGKTTTLNTISGLLKPSLGEIVFMGHKINDLAPAEIVKKGICQCPEGRKVWPEMTVWENLQMGAYVRRDKNGIRKGFERVYAYFPILKERSLQLAGNLSGGEQQMVALGRALMSKPKLLLLDEPSLGLAPIVVHELSQIIKEIRSEGVAILLVEQNAFLALNISDKGYVLETGKVVIDGTAYELLQNERVKRAYLGEHK